LASGLTAAGGFTGASAEDSFGMLSGSDSQFEYWDRPMLRLFLLTFKRRHQSVSN
jgi:hypothetical protein